MRSSTSIIRLGCSLFSALPGARVAFLAGSTLQQNGSRASAFRTTVVRKTVPFPEVSVRSHCVSLALIWPFTDLQPSHSAWEDCVDKLPQAWVTQLSVLWLGEAGGMPLRHGEQEGVEQGSLSTATGSSVHGR